MKTALVLACGNTQCSDDGVGPAVADHLRNDDRHREVEILSSIQWTPELAEPISKVDIVVFLDAAEDLPPGTIRCSALQPEALPAQSLTHHTSPGSLLLLAEELYGRHPEQAYLVTVGGNSFVLGEQLSEIVRGAIPTVARRIEALLSGTATP